MKNKKIIFIILSVIVIIVFTIIFEVISIINENKYKNRIFSDMEVKTDDVIRGVVGIVPESDSNGLTSYNGIGSGVIFDRKDDIYYVITAKHVINKDNSKFKIFTRDTEFSGQIIKADDNVNFEIPDSNYYESLLDGKVEYISETDDLAILSFKYDGDLTVLNFESKELSINDKIMVIGHPEGSRYQITYGYIKSKLKDVRNDKVLEHNAYMKQGNSCGVALTENMKIAGINISGKFTLLGHYRKGYMIPYNIVKDNINKYKTKESEIKVSSINAIINGKSYKLNLDSNKTTEELVNLLPLELTMNELNGNEKYAYMDNSLFTNSYNPKHIEKGDVMLYGDNCLVIFYKSFDTNYHYTKIGHIDNLNNLGNGSITVKFE